MAIRKGAKRGLLMYNRGKGMSRGTAVGYRKMGGAGAGAWTGGLRCGL